ncbi:MAG: HAMP domain-containing histidine kinase [Gammaproteobacteria bacterium]|nr:HAMP domain-containing histidine kinase [Gammaproteobacteria bacterium]
MPLKIATSIRQLILIGFFLVVLPLIVSLISTIIQVDRLSSAMKTTVQNSSQTMETSRFIVSQVLSLERTAGQYLVLFEAQLMDRYIQQREQLLAAIGQLQLLPVRDKTKNSLAELQAAEAGLWERIHTAQKPANDLPAADDLPDLSGVVQGLPADVSRAVAGMTRSMERKINRVQRLLLLQAVGLIPLVLLLATFFSVLITRPMGQLTNTIRRLGEADFTTPIQVDGPEDIKELGNRLDWLRQKLADIDQQKLAFLQHVSHELKTPLTALREGVALMEEEIPGPLTPDQREVVGILRDNGMQLQKEVEALLDFNLSLSQEKPANYESLSMDGLVRDIIERHRLELRARGIGMQTSLDAVSVHGDHRQLSAVVDNLVSNAIKYSPDTSTITIILGRQNESAVLDVIDNGPGISAGERTQIFKPFYQGVNKSQASVSGTGLGLAIVHRYVLLHHGSVSVENTLQGAHFRVQIPLQITEDSE